MQPFLRNIDLVREELIRKQWLVSLYVFTAFHTVSTLLSCLVGGDFTPLIESTGIAFGSIVVLALSCLLSVPLFWITYHCAYKKRGTAWLMWIMIVNPLGELGWLVGVYEVLAEGNGIFWYLLTIVVGIEVFYWINCWRLRKVNSIREYQRVLALKAKYGSDVYDFSS